MIRIGVVSDTHGHWQQVAAALKTWEKIDLICHGGDFYADGIALGKHLNIDTRIVAGNCDPEKWEQELLFEIGQKRIFLTHGHNFGVKKDYQRLYYKALEVKADIVICGHTHIPIYFKQDHIVFVNPGSPTSSRNYSAGSYAIIEIDKGVVTVEICDLF